MTRKESDFEESQAGSVDFKYPDDEPEPDSADLRTIQRQSFESAIKLLLACRTPRVQHMRASVAIAILNGDLKVSSIASHFSVTVQRVRRVVKEIKAFESFSARQW
jgi:hypothetical protein